MDNEEGGGIGGRKYRPVVADDRAVLEMSSLDPSSSSSVDNPRKIKVSSETNMKPDESVSSSGSHADVNGIQSESKLELFGFDSLVNILGLRSMTGEQIHAPSSPRDGEDISITLEQPRTSEVKLGTMMGVFLPCLQNILGIIYYIRFTWIVGMAGIGGSLLLVSFCCLCTFLTAVSLSAIATNGAMKGGGPYYLIGRALGPEVGVSIGLCYFLGTAVAGALCHQGESLYLRHVLKNPELKWSDIPSLPSAAYSILVSKFLPLSSTVDTVSHSTDGVTTKLLVKLQNGAFVEAVVMRYDTRLGQYAGKARSGGLRSTLCVSSQVGCKMGCKFCATGSMGFKSNLTTGEIVEQLVHASRISNIPNVVFMGMGEPLNNYSSVVEAVRMMTRSPFQLSPRRITISTVKA